MHDFFKVNFCAEEVMSKVGNDTKKTNKQNIIELFKHNNKPLLRLDCETRWGTKFLILERMSLVRDLLGKIALANEPLLFPDVNWFSG